VAPLPIRLVCTGCGFTPAAGELPPWRCPRSAAGDDVDHVLRRRLDAALAGPPGAWAEVFADPEPDPFRRFRRLLQSYQQARAGGLGDGDFARLVADLDAAVAAVDGRGFRETPFAPSDALRRALGVGELWVKDETGNVAGSHKGRHLMGVALWLALAERLGGPPGWGREHRLAIASCGNAALAAAVVARAAGRPLEVFIPPWADPGVLARLGALGAGLTVCRRSPGEVGDPCYHRFRRAVAAGALPFTCQGPDDGLVIEGGQTLAWEMVATLRRQGRTLDRLFVQVGGGALATACIQGLDEARALGLFSRLPRIHAVQTTGASPLARAYERVLARVLEHDRREGGEAAPPTPAGRAEHVLERVPGALVAAELRYAATHRSEFMWPWESEPRSLATGILDDETYDWLAVVRGMLGSGGFPVVVGEETLAAAHRLAREATGIAVDPTGTAGLAGCLELAASAGLAADETVGVLFTGAERRNDSW
jgi:threonine synthase